MPTWSNTAKTGTIQATAGLYYGFGLFTYAGGEILQEAEPASFTNTTKNVAVFINQDKN